MRCTVCPGSSDPFYLVTYFIKWVTTSWTYSMIHIFPSLMPSIHQKILFSAMQYRIHSIPSFMSVLHQETLYPVIR